MHWNDRYLCMIARKCTGTSSLWRRWRPTGCVIVFCIHGLVPFLFRSTVLFAQRGFGDEIKVPKPGVNWPRPKIWRTQQGCVTFCDGQTGATSVTLWLKDFTLKTFGAFSPNFSALRETNSFTPSSVVSVPKFPTYRTAFFTVGFFFVTNAHESSSDSHAGGVVRRAHAGLSSLFLSSLLLFPTCWSCGVLFR